MRTFKFKIFRQIFEIILVGTVIPSVFIYGLKYLDINNFVDENLVLLFLVPWLFINGLFISSLSGTLVVTPTKMTRKMSGFVLTVKFKDIHKIKYKKYKKEFIFFSTGDKKLNINSNYKEYKDLYHLVVKYLIKKDKTDIIPNELLEYYKK